MKIDLRTLPPKEALDKIAAAVRKCQRCSLSKGRTKAVPGEGNPQAEVMFIGEAPGFNEDQQGIPFCGRAGHLLDEALASIHWKRQEVFITNVVKCRPPNNRDPQPEEITACQPFLNWQIKIIKPLMIVTLGRFSMAKFLPQVKISQVHGQVYPLRWQDMRLVVVPLYHPAAALRNGRLRQVFMDEFTKLPGYLSLAKKGFWSAAEEKKVEDSQSSSQQLKLI